MIMKFVKRLFSLPMSSRYFARVRWATSVQCMCALHYLYVQNIGLNTNINVSLYQFEL